MSEKPMLYDIDNVDVFHDALELWGHGKQIDMMMEECAELIKAVIKFRRGKVSRMVVVSELVDVQIMLDQMKIVFCGATHHDKNDWDREYALKMIRLKQLVEKG